MKEESKHNCGQCEFYLHKASKCPHQEKMAFDEGCKKFEYTNPKRRIDALQAENKRLREVIESAL